MFTKNNTHKKQQQDEGYDFSDIQNPLNDSSRVGLVNKKSKDVERSNKYGNLNSNFDEMFDTAQGPPTKQLKKMEPRGSITSQIGEGDDISNFPQNKSIPSQHDNVKKDVRRQSENVQLPPNNESIDKGHIKKQKSSISQNLDTSIPQIHKDETPMNDSQQNIMIEGQLIENVGKRSEAANRKYRAFVHFLKYQKNHQQDKKGIPKGTSGENKSGTEKGTETANGDKNNGVTPPPQIDDLSQASDADDDFDDRYIHLIAAHSEINKAWGVIQPDSTAKGIWDLLCLLFIIYQAILIPFRLCFDVDAEGGMLILENIMDSCFMLDILVTFNTGFYKKGYLVMKRKEIVKNYLKTWFFIDLVATFPYSWVMGAGDDSDGSVGCGAACKTPQLLRLLKIVRFLRFLRLLRVLKLKKLLYKFEEIIMSDMLNAILGFFKVITVILFIAHWIACIFFAIGSSELDSEPVCWIVMSNIQDATIFDKYIISLYWAFTTMTTVGYGDVVPYTMSEKIYAMFSMLIACGVFAYVVGSIETIARRSNTMAAIFKEKILHVNQFLMHKQIPKYLRLKVRRYLEYMFEYKKQYKLSEIEVLGMLNENLKDQVIVHLNGRMLKNTKIFGIFDIRFLSEVTFLLINETFSMDDHIFEEDEKGTKMYFITKGTVVIMQKKSHTYIKELQVDEYFGEISFFSELNRQATARSRGFTEVLSLSRESFFSTAEQYPDALKTYQEIYMRLNKESEYSAIFVTCYLCGKVGHISINCAEKFHEIEGNLKRQIYKYKQQLMKQQKEATGSDKSGSKAIAQDGTSKSKINTIKEEDNESEEIKTEFSMYSDDDESDDADDSGTQKEGSKKGSRKYSKEISPLSKAQMSPQKVPGGALRLGVSVGAKTIQTAEKFIKKDQIEAQNMEKKSHITASDVDKSWVSKSDQQKQKSEEETKRQVDSEFKEVELNNPIQKKNNQEVRQDIMPQQDQAKPKQVPQAKVKSTQMLLKNLEGSSANVNQNIKASPQQQSPKIKSILKQQSPPEKKKTHSKQYYLKKNTPSMSSSRKSSVSSISGEDINNFDLIKDVITKQPSLAKQQSKPSASPNVLVEAKLKSSQRHLVKVVSQDDPTRVRNDLAMQGNKRSQFSQSKNMSSHDVLNGTAHSEKRKKDSNEKHIENFIHSISPFNDVTPFDKMLQKEKSIGLHGLLPSLNDHKASIMSGSNLGSRGVQKIVEEYDEDEKGGQSRKANRKSFVRSSTLLKSIKEEHKPDEQVGVVPKDLGYGFLKDLLEEENKEESNKTKKQGTKKEDKRKSIYF